MNRRILFVFAAVSVFVPITAGSPQTAVIPVGVLLNDRFYVNVTTSSDEENRLFLKAADISWLVAAILWILTKSFNRVVIANELRKPRTRNIWIANIFVSLKYIASRSSPQTEMVADSLGSWARIFHTVLPLIKVLALILPAISTLSILCGILRVPLRHHRFYKRFLWIVQINGL